MFYWNSRFLLNFRLLYTKGSNKFSDKLHHTHHISTQIQKVHQFPINNEFNCILRSCNKSFNFYCTFFKATIIIYWQTFTSNEWFWFAKLIKTSHIPKVFSNRNFIFFLQQFWSPCAKNSFRTMSLLFSTWWTTNNMVEAPHPPSISCSWPGIWASQ